MNNAVFRKTMANVSTQLVTTKARRNYLVSDFFYENLLAIEMKRQILMNKPVYLGLSI